MEAKRVSAVKASQNKSKILINLISFYINVDVPEKPENLQVNFIGNCVTLNATAPQQSDAPITHYHVSNASVSFFTC